MAKKKETAIAVKDPVELDAFDYGDYEGEGDEDVDSSHYAVPWVKLLQTNSPECTPDGGNLGQAGQFLITSDETVHDHDVGLVGNLAMVEHNWTEWVPRDKGGGFVAVHESGSAAVKAAGQHPDKKGMRRTADGNDLVETFYMYLALDDGTMAIVPFKSMGIKPYKSYMGKIGKHVRRTKDGKTRRFPLPARRVKITAEFQKNTKGSFWNYVVTPESGDAKTSVVGPDHDGFQLAHAFRTLLKEGQAKVDYNTGGNDAGPSADEEAPF